jgi:hypothetical protein
MNKNIKRRKENTKIKYKMKKYNLNKNEATELRNENRSKKITRKHEKAIKTGMLTIEEVFA